MDGALLLLLDLNVMWGHKGAPFHGSSSAGA